MSVLIRPAKRALGLTIALASVAGAQAAPAAKECEVNESRPTQLGRATVAVQVASGAQTPESAIRNLTNAVKLLTDNADRWDNQTGRNFVLGKALVLWTLQPNIDLVAKRGALGYATNPEGMIDLAAAIDTAFKVVEASNPECIPETARWRGQKAWIALVNRAIETLNSEEIDTAEAVAKKAILLNPYGPYGYVVLGNVAQKRNRATEAFALYRKAVDAALLDTAYADIKRQSLFYLGNLAADSAEIVTDAAARRPYMETARAAFEEILRDKEGNEMLSSARAGLCRLAIASGDTASLRETYAEPLAAPAGFSYNDLMNAGVCMARAEMVPEATTLFQAAFQKNQYHRDALSNLTIMLLRADKHDEAREHAERLVSVEPNNPESLQLLVFAYAGIAKRARDTRLPPRAATPTTKTATKTGARPATTGAPRLSQAVSDSLFKIEQQYTALAVSTNERKEKLPVRVSLSEFSFSDAKSTIAGSVTNQGTTDKPITVKVDFLDATGKVVASKESAVGSVAAGASARFSITQTPGTGIAAFRYTVE